MAAHARPAASGQNRWRPPWRRVRSAGLFLLETLAIVGGHALLGWLGHHLMFGRWLPIFWPAGGFALAMLLLRGCSRWPAILLGSALISEDWIFKLGAPSPLQGHTFALLMGISRTLAAIACVQLIRRWLGVTLWPSSARGVVKLMIVAGLAYPALVSLMTIASLWLTGTVMAAPVSLTDQWTWFAANSTGTLIVTPLILTFAAPRPTWMSHSSWEMALLIGLYGIASFVSIEFGRLFLVGTLISYPTVPLMLWATLRFGSRGAGLNNLAWTVVILGAALQLPLELDLAQVLPQVQARIAVLAAVILVLGANVEERQQMRVALEKERRQLALRVAERTLALERSFSLLNSSLESTADGILVVDQRGHITAMNQRFAELWRIPNSILESGDDTKALEFANEQVADREEFLLQVAYLYAHPDQESEDELSLADGRIFERFSRPQRMGDAIIGRVWSFRDITQRRRAEAERDRLLVEESQARQLAERALREAQRALGLRDEFLTIAAHELKTPLTSMKVQIQHLERLLASGAFTGAERSRLSSVVATASRQLKRFQNLCEQFLDITRLTLGKIELRYERIDFRELVVEQFRSQAEAASRAGSELRFECVGPILGEWDRLRLERIVCHLLSNAIKFGAGQPITVRLDALEDRVWLQVTDLGIGIAPEDHERIFERLERAVDSRHYGGLGLGLWIVRESAVALGGGVTVSSALGEGATFTVELPRTQRSERWVSTPPVQGEHTSP